MYIVSRAEACVVVADTPEELEEMTSGMAAAELFNEAMEGFPEFFDIGTYSTIDDAEQTARKNTLTYTEKSVIGYRLMMDICSIMKLPDEDEDEGLKIVKYVFEGGEEAAES